MRPTTTSNDELIYGKPKSTNWRFMVVVVFNTERSALQVAFWLPIRINAVRTTVEFMKSKTEKKKRTNKYTVYAR